MLHIGYEASEGYITGRVVKVYENNPGSFKSVCEDHNPKRAQPATRFVFTPQITNVNGIQVLTNKGE